MDREFAIFQVLSMPCISHRNSENKLGHNLLTNTLQLTKLRLKEAM